MGNAPATHNSRMDRSGADSGKSASQQYERPTTNGRASAAQGTALPVRSIDTTRHELHYPRRAPSHPKSASTTAVDRLSSPDSPVPLIVAGAQTGELSLSDVIDLRLAESVDDPATVTQLAASKNPAPVTAQ